MKPQFLIAAPSSDSGKTTFTLGLLRILADRGYRVQPFKCGPDYLDTKHHTLAAGNPSINLDTFMMSAAHVRNIYSRYCHASDAAVTEGVMGLFDGAERMKGSSAEIALLLGLPVILVINAGAMAYSAAPLIYGFRNFHPEIKIAGVVFNFVSSESHYLFLKEACTDAGVEPLGYIPFNHEMKIPSRHLGLNISPEHDYENSIRQAAATIEKTVDVDRLLKICTLPVPSLSVSVSVSVPLPVSVPEATPLTIAIASDEAFSFTYYENIEAMKRLGRLSFFSPLKDQKLPEADLVYLPGGYPELYLEKLSSNMTFKKSLLEYCEKGGNVLAECGGLMYLGEHITDKEGKAHPMVGFLNLETSMEHAKICLGYRRVVIQGKEYKGHEFHFSSLKEKQDLASIAVSYNARDVEVPVKVYRKQNVIASYVHFYWGEDLHMLKALFAPAHP